MSFYRIDRMHASDLHAQSMGNIPIRVTNSPFGDRVELVDPNPTTPAIDPDGCDTPNFSLRTCDPEFAELLRRRNLDTRRAANRLLADVLGHRAAAQLNALDDQLARSLAAFFGRFNAADIDAVALPPRSRSRNSNPPLPTDGDPDFRRASGKYRRLRRLDTHRKLGPDASWFTSHHYVIITRSR
jgi:hypothetical protein